MVKSRFLEQQWHFWSMATLSTTVDFWIISILNPFLVIWLLLFYFKYRHDIFNCQRKLKKASSHVMLDLISHMICHMTALVVITTAVFKGGTSFAPISEKKINEQMLKIINTSSLCSLQSTGLSKNCSANRFVCSQVLKRVKRLSGKKSLKSSTGPKSAVSTITLVLLRNGESSCDLNRYRKPRLPKQVVFALEENKQETLPWRLQFPHS